MIAITISTLSEKQKKVLCWAHGDDGDKYDSIICDGAVRSGKTAAMTLGFVYWAMRYFSNSGFAICGKTVGSVERNIIEPLMNMSDVTAYYGVEYLASKNKLIINEGRRKNVFYIFGGKDDASASLIQGVTLSGVFFDEVALMPQSFVEQAIARTLSVKGAKLWFNCNPEHPDHWFYREWICDADGENNKRILHLHFLMSDNPALGEDEINRAKSLYSGAFLRRYIYGEWVAADGLVYGDTPPEVGDYSDKTGKYFISVDYGVHNPFSMGLWCVSKGVAYRIAEYYHDSRKTRRQLTDEEYYEQLTILAGNRAIRSVIVDPSAGSFITLIRRRGRYNVLGAKNDVINGIRTTASMLRSGRVKIDEKCTDILREFRLYCWDGDSDADRVVKENDHAMDDMRYFCYTVLRRQSEFSGGGESRSYYERL